MAISHVGTSTGSSGTSGTALGVNMPAGVQEGDVAYALMGGSNTSDITITDDSGTWTKLGELYANDTLDANFALFRKVQGATPDTAMNATASGTLTSRVGLIKVLRGVDNTTPEDATTTTATGIDTPDPNPPSINTVTDGAWVIAFGGSTGGGTVTQPTGYSNAVSVVAGDNESTAAAADKPIPTAAAEDPDIFNLSVGNTADCWVAFTVAARPAGGSTYTLAADAGSYAMTGTAASLELGREVVAATGSYTLTGAAIALELGREVTADAGSYLLTGSAASLELGREIVAAIGSYLLTGAVVTLTYSGAEVVIVTDTGKRLVFGLGPSAKPSVHPHPSFSTKH
jgi:uncharacterized protein YsxB (DUF464 family)